MTRNDTTIAAFLDQWSAAELRGDSASLDSFLTDGFVGVGPLGFLLSKQDWLARRDGGLQYTAFHLEDVTVRVYGDAAIVVAHQVVEGTHRGNPVPRDVRISLFLVSDAGTWRIAGTQISFMAGTPGAPPMPGAPS